MFLTIDSSALNQNANNVELHFNRPFIGLQTITLKSVTMYNAFYNYHCNRFQASFECKHDNATGQIIKIPDGFYKYHQMADALLQAFKRLGADTNKIKIWLDPITGHTKLLQTDNKTVFTLYPPNMFGFKSRGFYPSDEPYVSEEPARVYPFHTIQVHCNILQKDYNYFNSEPSDILCTLDVKESFSFGSKHTYAPDTKKRIVSEFNSIRLSLTDEFGVGIDMLNDFPIIYTLELN